MLDLAVLAAWREIVHADFLFSQRRGGRKGIPTECWTWRLGGLARDSSRRFFVLVKARRTQRNPTECWTWRLGGLARDSSRRFFVLAKAQRALRNSCGMLDLASLAAWREIVHADFLFSQRRGERKGFLRNAGLGGLARDTSRRSFVLAKAQRTQRNSYGMPDLASLAAWREIHHADFLFSQRRKGRKGNSYGMQDLADLAD